MLWILDASINTSMQPFRAFVGDQLAAGAASHSAMRCRASSSASVRWWRAPCPGCSSIWASATLPRRASCPTPCAFPSSLAPASFSLPCCGPSFRRANIRPHNLEAFADASPPLVRQRQAAARAGSVVGDVGVPAFTRSIISALDQQLYLVCAGAFVWGWRCYSSARVTPKGFFGTIMRQYRDHARRHAQAGAGAVLLLARPVLRCGSTRPLPWPRSSSAPIDAPSAAYNQGANWVGVLFAAYNGFAALASIVLPRIAAPRRACAGRI